MLKIIVLVENKISRSGFIGEHGLCLFVEYGNNRFLFDLGQGRDTFIKNALSLGVPISEVDFVVLSHGHYDHTGGIVGLIDIGTDEIPIYASPYIRREKYKLLDNGEKKYIGIPDTFSEKKLFLDFVFGVRKIPPDICLIPYAQDYGYPHSLSDRLIDSNGVRDEFIDELYLCIEYKKGLIILTGCSHRGILNIVEYARNITGIDEVYAVIGGFHMKGFDKGMQIGKALKEMGVERIYPMHCTNVDAICAMKQVFKSDCEVVCCGEEIVFS